MLAEGFVAFIALVTVMIATSDSLVGPDGRMLSAGKIYGNGIGNFLTLLIGKQNLQFAITFGAMAFSTFVFDTLDVTMRLGRYLIQELLGLPGRAGAVIGTLVTVALPFALIFFAKPGSYVEFWTLFGASNQLLAALTLLSITAWLYKARRRIAFTLIPMLFVLVITLWALGSMVYVNLQTSAGVDIKLINGLASLSLIGLAIFLVVTAWIKSRTLEVAPPPAEVL
jgi:carbon starvation protein